MDIQNTRARDITWLVADIEVTERDMVDVGAWETVEEEKHACPDIAPEAILSAVFPEPATASPHWQATDSPLK